MHSQSVITSAGRIGQTSAPPARATVGGLPALDHREVIPWFMVAAFVLCMFIPGPIFLTIGTLQITPLRLMSLILCPWLLASSVIHWSWPDKVAVATLVAWFVSNALSADIFRALEASGRVFVASLLTFSADSSP
jgi:hypothetical protein